MSIRNLEYLFKPKSVAVVGASIKPHSLGATAMHNMIRYCRERGLKELLGTVLSYNERTLALCRKYGFSEKCDGDTHDVCLKL